MRNGSDYRRGPTSSPEMSWRDFLERVCDVPCPLRDEAEWSRHHHLDVKEMTAGELCLEADRVRMRLVLDDRPDDWLLRRLAALQEALTHAR
jgi:hypothetical protein